MKRRSFLVLGIAIAVLPVCAKSQPAVPVIGFLNTASAESFPTLIGAFRKGLADTGFIEGENVIVEYRWAEGHPSRLHEMASELVQRRVNLIAATGGSPAALAAKAATTTIPVVFQVGVDPVDVGLANSFNRPGGNATGVTMLAVELGSKRLELLKHIVTAPSVIGALINPDSPGAEIQSRDLLEAADKLGVKLQIVEATSVQDIVSAFAELRKMPAGGVWIGADPLFNSQSQLLATLSVAARIPAIYQFRDFTSSGGLMSYSGNITQAYRQAAIYCGRILKGEKVADLPIQQSTNVELIVNLKTAKLLGIEIPAAILGRADEVIE